MDRWLAAAVCLPAVVGDLASLGARRRWPAAGVRLSSKERVDRGRRWR
jgi:hypothetical protein